jgi:hypothetical protein
MQAAVGWLSILIHCSLVGSDDALSVVTNMVIRFASTRRIVIGAMLLVAIALLDTRTAIASCGDWLADHGDSPGEAQGSTPSQTPTPAVPSPCRGPQCRTLPEEPLPTSPDRRLSYQGAEWAALLATILLEEPPYSLQAGEGSLLLPNGLKCRIDRPPRA